jgi:hypothetical protein
MNYLLRLAPNPHLVDQGPGRVRRGLTVSAGAHQFMNKPYTHHFEQSLFTAAAEGLSMAWHQGNADKTGADALEATLLERYDRLFRRLKYGKFLSEIIVRGQLEDNQYFDDLGKAVEMAAELAEPVDQQR